MSKKDEIFIPALKGKKIPIISLDNKWYRLMAGIEHTPEMIGKEKKLKDLLKKQGKINTELKNIRKEKAALMDKIVGVMDENDSAEKQADYSDRINECNSRIDSLQDDLMELPGQINDVNLSLMLDTMEICDRVIADNTGKINEFNDWIDNVRVELKKNVVRRQECEMKNQQMYFYMHDIFGPDVMDIFDMQYNPEDRMIKASELVPEKK